MHNLLTLSILSMTVTKEYTAAAIAIFDSLKSVPISQILRKSHRDLVAVFDTFSLIDFLDTLAAGNYLAAPVLHEAETGNVLMGVLSLTHVISYCFVHGAFAATV